MAIVSIVFGNVCAGGNHVDLGVRVNGGAEHRVSYVIDDLTDTITVEKVRDAVLMLVRLHCHGLTRAQARVAIQAGISVVTS